VLGLLLIVGDRWMLLKTVTAFTVAHSLTLAAATFGVVRVWRGQTSFTIRHPWVVAFGFGLLHGFGFASGLAALGLPRSEVPMALLLFNVGVELGQLAFVAAVFALLRAFRILRVEWPAAVHRLPGYLLGTLGAYWTFQRVAVTLRGLAW